MARSARCIITLGLFIAPSPVCGMRWAARQDAVVTVGETVAVTSGWDSRPLIEPQLAANPRGPGHLLGAMMVSTAAADWVREQRCGTVHSLDGGRTWTQSLIDVVGCGDPWVAIDGDGRAILTVLGTLTDSTASAPHLLVFSSPDGGRTWPAPPQDLGGGQDHETAIADDRGSAYVLSSQGRRDAAGRVRFSVYLAGRRGGAEEFEVLQRFIPSNLNLNTQGLALLSDGSLVVTFVDFQRPRPPGAGPREGLLERPRTWALVLDSTTSTLGAPLLISESCASGSYLAADRTTGPFRDRLYLICPDRDGAGVLVHLSSDRGERWSSARYVEPPASRPRSRSQPQVAVNGDGVLGVSWLDVRNDPSGRCYDLYFTASLDGGATFLPSTRVSRRSSCPDPTRNGSAFERWPRGGDYIGLTATSDGTFHALWPDVQDGIFQTMTATITVRRPD